MDVLGEWGGLAISKMLTGLTVLYAVSVVTLSNAHEHDMFTVPLLDKLPHITDDHWTE